MNSRLERLRQPDHRPLVAPSILSADFASLGEECRAVLDAGADALHLDVMDGHFVPNLTMGPALCASLRKAFPDVILDVHLMVEEPARFVDPFEEAGADLLTFHIEAVPDPRDLADRIHGKGMAAGLAMNPPTSVDRVLSWIDAFDLVLVMSVNPGFSGQRFIDGVLEKTRLVAERLKPHQRLEMDGGINRQTAAACTGAGCDLLVAATAVFKAPDYRDAIADLRAQTGSSSCV